MQKLNTTLVYILSIVGIMCCWVYGLGTVAAIIAIVIASKELKKYNANPEQFVNGPAMKTARTVSIVALFISFIGLALVIYAALNECAFNEWMYTWSLEHGASEEQLAPMLEAMEEAGCR